MRIKPEARNRLHRPFTRIQWGSSSLLGSLTFHEILTSTGKSANVETASQQLRSEIRKGFDDHFLNNLIYLLESYIPSGCKKEARVAVPHNIAKDDLSRLLAFHNAFVIETIEAYIVM